MKQLLYVIIALGYVPASLAMENNAFIIFQIMSSVEKESLLYKNRETQINARVNDNIPKHQTANPQVVAARLAGNNNNLRNVSENSCMRFLNLFCCGQCND
ncbi:hypothetical protein HYX58_02235 [Candidatus Dependentiae bacterium]|nr:hypothetical protein [Candidatus Dependentiae bacterium]